jgi:hypothetical protein
VAASVQNISVQSTEHLDQTIGSFIAQGFVVMSRTAAGATLFKKKEFSVLWLVVGLILCVFPLLIYLIIYATQSDQMVEIRVVPGNNAGQLSPDGRYRWDGTRWVAIERLAPDPTNVGLPPSVAEVVSPPSPEADAKGEGGAPGGAEATG